MVPVNLVSEIKAMGFDYNLSPRNVADALRNGHTAIWDKTITLHLDGKRDRISLLDLPDAVHLHAQNK